jgi:hypothetical protein
MVRIGDVWDSTVDAARGRAGMIAPIALATIFLPAVAQGAVTAFTVPESRTASLLTAAVGLVALALAVWGQLAILAIATDPATTRADAARQAGRRFLPGVGVALLIAVIAVLLLLPMIVALAVSGIDLEAVRAAQATGAQPDLSGAAPGPMLFLVLYGLALLLFVLWALARVSVLVFPVVLNERRGAGAIRRAVALSRGLTMRLIAVIVLYILVALVAGFAAEAVIAVPLGLMLGTGGVPLATFLGAVASALVSTALAVLFSVFGARLYVALAGAPLAKDVAPSA